MSYGCYYCVSLTNDCWSYGSKILSCLSLSARMSCAKSCYASWSYESLNYDSNLNGCCLMSAKSWNGNLNYEKMNYDYLKLNYCWNCGCYLNVMNYCESWSYAKN